MANELTTLAVLILSSFRYHKCRVGHNHIYTVFLAENSPNIQPYAAHLYGSGQSYIVPFLLLVPAFSPHNIRMLVAVVPEERHAIVF